MHALVKKLKTLRIGDVAIRRNPVFYASVSDELITTIIDAEPFLEQTRQAMHCHQTQWNPAATVDAMFESRRKSTGGKVYLRLALSRVGQSEGTERDLLERVKVD